MRAVLDKWENTMKLGFRFLNKYKMLQTIEDVFSLPHLSNSYSPVSPEVQPRFVKGTKRYGRRSTPEFTHSISGLAHTPSVEREDDAPRTSDGTLPVKREVKHTHNHTLQTS